MAANINILVALTCEAKPLIQYFKLQRAHQYKAFPFFIKDNIRLLVSGVGQINMAAGCGWLAAILVASNQYAANDVWLNIGTAGHADLTVGEGFVVSQIDTANSKMHYPAMIADWKGHYSALQTLDQPSDQYREGLAFDMEAHAFFMAAQKFTSAELIQSYKVISDNTDSSIEKLNANKLTTLIEGQLPKIDEYLNNLSGLAQSAPQVDMFESIQHILKQIHFTQTQRHQLKELWRRWQVVKLNTQQPEIDLSVYSDAKQLIACLADRLLIAPKL